MKTIAKKYLRFMWFYSQAYSLITIPLSGFSIAISFFTFLAVAFGIRLVWWEYIALFAAVITIVGGVGIIIVEAGLVAYYQSMTNKQSPELLEILKTVQKLAENKKIR